MGWSSTFGATCKSWQSVYSLDIPPLPPRCPGLMCCKQCTISRCHLCRCERYPCAAQVGRLSRRSRSPLTPTCGCVDFDHPLMWRYAKIVANGGNGWSLPDVVMDRDTFVWVCPFSLVVLVFLSVSLARCLQLALGNEHLKSLFVSLNGKKGCHVKVTEITVIKVKMVNGFGNLFK